MGKSYINIKMALLIYNLHFFNKKGKTNFINGIIDLLISISLIKMALMIYYLAFL